jgi:hypothetical protein
MNITTVTSLDSRAWKEFYKAALFELDTARLPERIAEAGKSPGDAGEGFVPGTWRQHRRGASLGRRHVCPTRIAQHAQAQYCRDEWISRPVECGVSLVTIHP